ncbi:MAG TPA: bifunctional glycosyltransferase family 2/GtrA family protein [Thermoanaerobaculaceae bacterium]|nr:bifunctional glycosyltransferase family 2/GtrA family protein [Thermoanaerobaculaceae bacterium]
MPSIPSRLTIVIPCYNEEQTLAECVRRVLAVQDDALALEVIVVDDCSRDKSLTIAEHLAADHPEVRVLRHRENQGKGAALRTGFREATGDFVAVQDADLEYDPRELPGLLEPLRSDQADVVFGSRFLGGRPHRVLYFWHYLGNAFLTFLSNMFTDLNLTDMEVGYKVFRRDVIQSIPIQENRFGFEPEIVAKVAQRRLRVFEMGISYAGRTYEEGKKIGWRDGVRALYCIFRYNAHQLPLPMQLLIYFFIGGAAALVNLAAFLALLAVGCSFTVSTILAFAVAAATNYFLCIALLFRHRARWNTAAEIVAYLGVVAVAGALDLGMTKALWAMGYPAWLSKATASFVGFVLNFLGRKFLVFPETTASWESRGDSLR